MIELTPQLIIKCVRKDKDTFQDYLCSLYQYNRKEKTKYHEVFFHELVEDGDGVRVITVNTSAVVALYIMSNGKHYIRDGKLDTTILNIFNDEGCMDTFWKLLKKNIPHFKKRDFLNSIQDLLASVVTNTELLISQVK